MDERPEIIVCIGDFGDFPSLNAFDRPGSKTFEGQRLEDDLRCVGEAMDKLLAPLNRYRRKCKGKARYKPKLVMCLGNHEDRITRAIESNPRTLDGILSLKKLPYEEWRVIPFKKSVSIEQISMSHYFGSGIMGRAISGEHIGATMCNKLHTSAVQGHSHIFNIAERTRPDGKKLFGLACGCYVHPDYSEDWCLNSTHLWWRGVILIETDGKGYYNEFRAVTQRQLKKRYAN